MNNIRNFLITAHIDHGKSTLADRMLELTGTVEMRSMKPQYLDQLDLERERGITIKMAPVRMLYQHSTRISVDQNADKGGLLYESLTFKIRGALFNVYNNLGPSYKEIIYGNALEMEFKKIGLSYEREKAIDVMYDNKKVGVYRPDFVIDSKIILEIKAQPFIGKLEIKQTWYYLKGSDYRLGLLVNFGSKELQIERIIYDTIRDNPRLDLQKSAKVEYILNLIDTPGHSDFSYEVSRALAAVEGAVLLVDATQGIQAQTLANYESAKNAKLTIIGAVNKIDVATPEQIEEAITELSELLGFQPEEILKVSGKTGAGVLELLETVVTKIPPPTNISLDAKGDVQNCSRALVFDSQYHDHKGVIAYIRVFSGSFEGGNQAGLLATQTEFKIKELGYFHPGLKADKRLAEGEIGYIATGIKDANKLKIGDTIISHYLGSISDYQPLPGYAEPRPVVYVSFYPEDSNQYEQLKQSIGHLQLNDAALRFEPDFSEILGRGFKGGFLGRLHFEITAERLAREFKIETVHSFPSVAYQIKIQNNGWLTITNPKDFPIDPAEVLEPMTEIEILTPAKYLGAVLGLKEFFRFSNIQVKPTLTKTLITAKLPLADLISDLDDKMKSVSEGFASLNYKTIGWERGEVEKLEILVAANIVPGLTRIVPKSYIEQEARVTVTRLKDLLPLQQFTQAIQASVRGKIVARETIAAMRKDVTGYLYGGDRTRKMKLWKKQQRGKKKLKEMAEHQQIKIPASIFKELLKK